MTKKNDVISEKLHLHFLLKTWQGENVGTRGKINAIWWHMKINLQKLVDICGYELPTDLQNFTQKDWTEVKIFLKVLGGYFFETPCRTKSTILILLIQVPLVCMHILFCKCTYGTTRHKSTEWTSLVKNKIYW